MTSGVGENGKAALRRRLLSAGPGCPCRSVPRRNRPGRGARAPAGADGGHGRGVLLDRLRAGHHRLVYALWKRGTYVLLPVLRPDMDLDWASSRARVAAAGATSLAEPAEPARSVAAVGGRPGDGPRLAVDRRGVRLGRGGGSYDRALARVGPQVPTIALLYDAELLDEVPAAPHDQRVRLVARPEEGITRLPDELPFSSPLP